VPMVMVVMVMSHNPTLYTHCCRLCTVTYPVDYCHLARVGGA